MTQDQQTATGAEAPARTPARTPARIPGQRSVPAQRAVSREPARGPVPVAPAADGWEHLAWRTVVRVAAARAVLGVVVGLLVWSLLPLAIGWTPRVILSGSMEPRISTGDVIVTRAVDPSVIGEDMVVTAEDPDKPGRTRTHRVVERDQDGLLVTKGDANVDADSTPVADAAVLGVGVLRVPLIGLPATWVVSRDTMALGLAFAGLSALVLAAWRPRGQPGDGSAGGPGRDAGARGGRRPGRRARSRTAVRATAASLVAVTLVAGGGPASAAFRAVTSGSASFAGAAAFDPYRDEVRGDSPTLFWRLNETSGSVVSDSSGNNRPGTAFGAWTWGVPGALLSEPGRTGARVDEGAVTANASVASDNSSSVELWVRTSTRSGGSLLTQGNGSGANASSQVFRALYLGSDGRVRFGQQDRVTTGPVVNDGEWHHVVATSSGAGGAAMRLYVDGVQVAQGRGLAGTTTGFWRSGAANIGSWTGSPSPFLSGDVDEVAVYADVLTANEVASHYSRAGY